MLLLLLFLFIFFPLTDNIIHQRIHWKNAIFTRNIDKFRRQKTKTKQTIYDGLF